MKETTYIVVIFEKKKREIKGNVCQNYINVLNELFVKLQINANLCLTTLFLS